MAFRQLVQPGPPAPVRVLSAVGKHACEVRIVLPAGATLLEAVRDAFDRIGVRSGSMTLAHGCFSTFYYHLPGSGSEGGKVIAYGAAFVLPPPVSIVTADAIFGEDGDGSTLHCHGGMVDGEGRLHGGHLAVDRCVIGAEGIVAFATCLMDAGFATGFDKETTFTLLQPYGPMGAAA